MAIRIGIRIEIDEKGNRIQVPVEIYEPNPVIRQPPPPPPRPAWDYTPPRPPKPRWTH